MNSQKITQYIDCLFKPIGFECENCWYMEITKHTIDTNVFQIKLCKFYGDIIKQNMSGCLQFLDIRSKEYVHLCRGGTMASDPTGTITNYKSETMCGVTLTDLYHPDNKKKWDNDFSNITCPECIKAENRSKIHFLSKSGKTTLCGLEWNTTKEWKIEDNLTASIDVKQVSCISCREILRGKFPEIIYKT